MARPRKPDLERWTLTNPKYTVGYVENFKGRGVAYTNIAGKRQGTGLVWAEHNKADALRILVDRLEKHFNPDATTNQAPVSAAPSTTLADALELYVHAQLADVSPAVKRWHDSATRHYLADPPAPDDDPDELRISLPLDPDVIHAEIVRRNKLSALATWTRRKHLQYLRKMFGYMLQKKLIESNPIEGIKIPPPPKKPENQIYTRDEVAAIVRHFEESARSTTYPDRRVANEQLALLIRFLVATAARIGEVLKLKWSDVSKSGIRIHGKGDAIRYFPLAPFPEVSTILSELAEYKKVNGGKLFPWNHAVNVSERLREAKKALDIPLDDGRAIHTFRATAEHRWREELKIPVEEIADLAGHSIAVLARDYRKQPTADEIAERVSHHIADAPSPNGHQTLPKTAENHPTPSKTKKAIPARNRRK